MEKESSIFKFLLVYLAQIPGEARTPCRKFQLLPRDVCVAKHNGDDVKEGAEGDDDAAHKVLQGRSIFDRG